jgi:hypothetical protein
VSRDSASNATGNRQAVAECGFPGYCVPIARTRGCGHRSRRTVVAVLLVGAGMLGLTAAAAQSGTPVLYGDTFLLSGSVEESGAGLAVVILARPHGRADYGEVARVRTTTGGRWRYTARPAIRTLYRAQVGRLLSTPVAVDVEPRIVFRRTRGRFIARVRAGRSLAGKFVVLQQRTTGGWRDVRRLVLDETASTTFRFPPPPTRTQIRLRMPRSQVGPGYVPATGPVFTFIG